MAKPMAIAEDRVLTDRERQLLERLLQHGNREAAEYAERLSQVRVVGRCGCGCPTIDLAVARRAASLGSPTTILAEAGGTSPEGVRFGVILHSREGLLSELEVYSQGSPGPFTLPEIDQIEIYGGA